MSRSVERQRKLVSGTCYSLGLRTCVLDIATVLCNQFDAFPWQWRSGSGSQPRQKPERVMADRGNNHRDHTPYRFACQSEAWPCVIMAFFEGQLGTTV